MASVVKKASRKPTQIKAYDPDVQFGDETRERPAAHSDAKDSTLGLKRSRERGEGDAAPLPGPSRLPGRGGGILHAGGLLILAAILLRVR